MRNEQVGQTTERCLTTVTQILGISWGFMKAIW